MKKLLTGILILAMSIQSIPVFAYDNEMQNINYSIDEEGVLKLNLDKSIEYDNIEDILLMKNSKKFMDT